MSKKLKLTDRNSKINLQYTYLNTVRSMKIDSSKPTIMQKRILPAETKEVRLRAKGSGFALLQVQNMTFCRCYCGLTINETCDVTKHIVSIHFI